VALTSLATVNVVWTQMVALSANLLAYFRHLAL
jgi:hypothetical protein